MRMRIKRSDSVFMCAKAWAEGALFVRSRELHQHALAGHVGSYARYDATYFSICPTFVDLSVRISDQRPDARLQNVRFFSANPDFGWTL